MPSNNEPSFMLWLLGFILLCIVAGVGISAITNYGKEPIPLTAKEEFEIRKKVLEERDSKGYYNE